MEVSMQKGAIPTQTIAPGKISRIKLTGSHLAGLFYGGKRVETDITELALIAKIKKQLENFDTVVLKEDEANALVEALEKAQRANAAQGDHINQQQDRIESLEKKNDELGKYAGKLETINAAAEKLVRCKGRYHSEQNYRALAALFGVMTPDLPPLDSESRTVTVKLPDYRHERFWDSRCEEFNPAAYQAACIEMWREEITAAGIKWETE